MSVFFRVLCGEQGVSGLDFNSEMPARSNFELEEDGVRVSSFESQGLIDPDPETFQLVSLLLLDLSGSITESPGGIDELKSAVRAYIGAINAAGRPHPIAVYGFDGREGIQPIATFDMTEAERDAAIDMLACDRVRFCVDPSTNLNGAIVDGVELVDAQRASVPPAVRFVESFLVVFSDGTDQAGRVPFASVSVALGASPSRIFAVGIEGEPGEDTLIAVGRDGYRAGTSVAELSEAFQGVATLVSDLANSYYKVDYCSPKRDGVHRLTVVATRDGIRGSLSATFDATGFTYGCISNPDTCEYGRADCDRDGMTCEVDLAADVLHCGGCGIACEAGMLCTDGRCAP